MSEGLNVFANEIDDVLRKKWVFLIIRIKFSTMELF